MSPAAILVYNRLRRRQRRFYNWLVLLLLVAAYVGLNLIEPFHRFVDEDMLTDLQYPLKSNTVPVWAVPIYAVIGPMVVFVGLYMKKRDVYDMHDAILGLLFSVLITGVLTDAIKDGVGWPRPNCFWLCFPDGVPKYENITRGVLCDGVASMIKEAHKSFPCGYSSWSFAGLGFLSWYLKGKIKVFDRRGSVAKFCIVVLPLLLAALVSVSRVDDYWHHWRDVFAGGILGLVVASFCYLQFHREKQLEWYRYIVMEREKDEFQWYHRMEQKLDEDERKLEEVGMRSNLITTVIKKLTSATIHSLPSRFCYLNKKVVGISLLGMTVCILAIGAFDVPLNQSLGIRREDQNMMFNKIGWSHGRSLIATLHGPWSNGSMENSDMISVDLRKISGSNVSSGQQQQHWYSHISSKYQEEATEMQNGTVKPHLPAHMSHKNMVGLWIPLVSVIILVLGIAVVCVLLWCYRSNKRVQHNELELSGGIMGPRRFQLCDLVAATSNFADENKLGQGGFGPVYKGYLRNQDCHVAVKLLSEKQPSQQQSEQGLREFKAEVKVMTQLRHRNIVNLVGWCEGDRQQLLLVYELMAQGSLDKHLYDAEDILTWQQRYKIALGLGSALLYLHRDCEKCIVHGDIKPANVMLDMSYNAKLGDFGQARLVEHGEEPRTTQVVAGTVGYIDPDFITNRLPRAELDVYSFGVVLLEIACGKRPASRQPNGASSLLAWVIHLYDLGMILDAADQRLNGEFDQLQLERVLVTGIWCAHRDPIQRPSMEQAMDVLRSADAELPVLRAVYDERHIRAMEEQAYGDLSVEDRLVDAVTRSTYFTSKDSAYLLAEE